MSSDVLSRSRCAGLLLGVSVVTAGLALAIPEGRGTRGIEAAVGAEGWLRQMEALLEQGEVDSAAEACRAGLSLHPWQPDLSRALTQIRLEQGQGDLLYDWMDEVTLGDARLAEQLFQIPEFKPWLEEDRFARLEREAYQQARD